MPDTKKLGLQSIDDIFGCSDKKISLAIKDIIRHIDKTIMEIDATINIYELKEKDYLPVLKNYFDHAFNYKLDNSDCNTSMIIRNVLIKRAAKLMEKYKV